MTDQVAEYYRLSMDTNQKKAIKKTRGFKNAYVKDMSFLNGATHIRA